MTKHVTVELDEAEEALIQAEADRLQITPEAAIRDVLKRHLDYDAWFRAEVQKGIDEADRGEFVPDEEVAARMQALRTELLARKTSK